MITRERVAPAPAWPSPPPPDVDPTGATSDAAPSQPAAAERTSRCRGARYLWCKRVLDLPLALLALVIALPIMAAVALLVRFTSPGPVLFAHRRVGRDGTPFRCLKFRTMHVDAEERLRSDPALWQEFVANGYKLYPDPRVIPGGDLLRKTSLDELPQLFNVLRGEMSLVGPRPIIEPELVEYGDRVDDFLSALPGMTGRWQAAGDAQLAYPGRTEQELGYVYEWSVVEDLRILARTVPVIARAVASRLVPR